jgi:hypothetical protein
MTFFKGKRIINKKFQIVAMSEEETRMMGSGTQDISVVCLII